MEQPEPRIIKIPGVKPEEAKMKASASMIKRIWPLVGSTAHDVFIVTEPEYQVDTEQGCTGCTSAVCLKGA